MKSIVNLLHEVGMLAYTPRSGFAFLGSGEQSVAEHSYRMALIGFALAKMSKQPVDQLKLLMICLVHDLPEARTGDLNYVNKRYVKADEEKAVADIKASSKLGRDLAAYIEEYRQAGSIEAHLAHDADQLELMLVLRRLADAGNQSAWGWFDRCLERLKTPEAKQLAEEIRTTPSDAWWS